MNDLTKLLLINNKLFKICKLSKYLNFSVPQENDYILSLRDEFDYLQGWFKFDKHMSTQENDQIINLNTRRQFVLNMRYHHLSDEINQFLMSLSDEIQDITNGTFLT